MNGWTENHHYIDVSSEEIAQIAKNSPLSYQIQAFHKEIAGLREWFDQNYSTKWQNFFMAHVPYVQY